MTEDPAPAAGAQIAARLLAGFISLLEGHAELAAAELQEGLAARRRAAAGLLGGGFLAALGFALLSVPLALVVGRLLGSLAFGFLAIGAAYLLLGAVIVAWCRRRLAGTGFLRETRQQLTESLRWLQEEILAGHGGKRGP